PRQTSEIRQIVFIQEKRETTPFRLRTKILVNEHGISEIVSRDRTLEMTWPLEAPQVLIKLRSGKHDGQISSSVAVQFWNQVSPFYDQRRSFIACAPNTRENCGPQPRGLRDKRLDRIFRTESKGEKVGIPRRGGFGAQHLTDEAGS